MVFLPGPAGAFLVGAVILTLILIPSVSVSVSDMGFRPFTHHPRCRDRSLRGERRGGLFVWGFKAGKKKGPIFPYSNRGGGRGGSVLMWHFWEIAPRPSELFFGGHGGDRTGLCPRVIDCY